MREFLQERADQSVAQGFGAQSAHTKPMAWLIETISRALGEASEEQVALAAIPAILGDQLTNPALLTDEQREFDPKSYARHLIHADPGGRFSILSLAWLPNQISPVHGHNAWGVVGIHEGAMENTCYTVTKSASGKLCDWRCEPTETQHATAGRIIAATSSDCDAHTLANPGPQPACTIHIYGMDLALDPKGINRYYE